MSNSISVFEIPLLVKFICQSLDPADILACRRVCKDWDHLFSPFEWQSVEIITATEYACELPDDDDFIPLYRNARLVWNLVLDNTTLFESLFNSNTSLMILSEQQDKTIQRLVRKHDFVRLLSLTCDMVYRSEGERVYSNRDYPKLLPTLIQQNPGLRHLHLRELDTTNTKYNSILFSAIGQHPTLTCLQYTIHLGISKLWSVVIRQMFGCIPESLRSFCIASCESTVTDFGDPVKTFKAMDRLKDEGLDWSPTRLQELDLDLDIRGYEGLLLFPILRNCPQLTSLCLGEIKEDMVEPLGKLLREHCPKLVALDLYWDELDHKDVSVLIQEGTVQNQLRSLGLRGWSSMVENPFNDQYFNILPSVLHHYGPTLQSLCLREGLRITHRDFAQIFWLCPQLKELTLARPEDPFERNYRSGLDSTSLHLLVSKPWTCMQLEVLQLTVVDDPRNESERQSTKDQELAGFFIQLGQLVRLREIHIGWMTFKIEYSPLFSEEMEPFWDHLSSLSRVEKFLIRSYDMTPNIPEEHYPFNKQSRVRWIEEHWPRLKEIQELIIIEE